MKEVCNPEDENKVALFLKNESKIAIIPGSNYTEVYYVEKQIEF